MAEPHAVPAEFKQYGEPVKSYVFTAFLMKKRTFWIFQRGLGMQIGNGKTAFAAWDEIKEVKGKGILKRSRPTEYRFEIFLNDGRKFAWFEASDSETRDFGTLLIAVVKKQQEASSGEA